MDNERININYKERYIDCFEWKGNSNQKTFDIIRTVVVEQYESEMKAWGLERHTSLDDVFINAFRSKFNGDWYAEATINKGLPIIYVFNYINETGELRIAPCRSQPIEIWHLRY